MGCSRMLGAPMRILWLKTDLLHPIAGRVFDRGLWSATAEDFDRQVRHLKLRDQSNARRHITRARAFWAAPAFGAMIAIADVPTVYAAHERYDACAVTIRNAFSLRSR